MYPARSHMDWIRIHGFELDCILGIWPFERIREQRVRLELSLAVDTRSAARTGRIAHTVRYDVVANQLAAMLHFRKYQLLEVAANELGAMLLAIYPAARCVRLRVEKPKALEGKALAASVAVERTHEDFPASVEQHGGTSVSTLLVTRTASLSVQRVAPGEGVVLPANCERSLLIGVSGALSDGRERIEYGDQLVLEGAEARNWHASAHNASEVFVCIEASEAADVAE